MFDTLLSFMQEFEGERAHRNNFAPQYITYLEKDLNDDHLLELLDYAYTESLLGLVKTFKYDRKDLICAVHNKYKQMRTSIRLLHLFICAQQSDRDSFLNSNGPLRLPETDARRHFVKAINKGLRLLKAMVKAFAKDEEAWKIVNDGNQSHHPKLFPVALPTSGASARKSSSRMLMLDQLRLVSKGTLRQSRAKTTETFKEPTNDMVAQYLTTRDAHSHLFDNDTAVLDERGCDLPYNKSHWDCEINWDGALLSWLMGMQLAHEVFMG